MNVLRLAAIVLLAALAGCEQPLPEPPPPPPRLERPVLTLNVAPDKRLKIRIPPQALMERGGIPGVFVLDDNGEARFRLVRTGRRDGASVDILSGLHGNETLVLGDLAAVNDGTPINILGTADKRR